MEQENLGELGLKMQCSGTHSIPWASAGDIALCRPIVVEEVLAPLRTDEIEEHIRNIQYGDVATLKARLNALKHWKTDRRIVRCLSVNES